MQGSPCKEEMAVGRPAGQSKTLQAHVLNGKHESERGNWGWCEALNSSCQWQTMISKATKPPQTVLPTKDQVFKYWAYEWQSNSKHYSSHNIQALMQPRAASGRGSRG